MSTKAEKSHLDAVAALPCIICGATPVHVHHLNAHGMGLRSDHFHTLPLCHYHHQAGPFGHAIHNGKRTFELNYGTEQELLGKVMRKLEVAS